MERTAAKPGVPDVHTPVAVATASAARDANRALCTCGA
jgi:hypothetical protein